MGAIVGMLKCKRRDQATSCWAGMGWAGPGPDWVSVAARFDESPVALHVPYPVPQLPSVICSRRTVEKPKRRPVTTMAWRPTHTSRNHEEELFHSRWTSGFLALNARRLEGRLEQTGNLLSRTEVIDGWLRMPNGARVGRVQFSSESGKRIKRVSKVCPRV